ncbi:menaquinol-cytochrome c reductase cytochrome b/c subunit [Candidatus Laterigemmans baculatus]|uniref:menaquinol-cytochrome c reductase cytochrome b/c subunit n=1 Tax=Candidatus Laterigemmans baculatus TaxID=2770505 RepID=UPI0013DCACB0|nr:menaquinol-cytochrome c reductase cytochrome b/c subunit [Candidatus Laterigemmans baculatus]
MASGPIAWLARRSRLKSAWHWVRDRFQLREIWQHVLDRRVAKGSWYFGDGATLFLLFIVLVVTGAAMTLSYSSASDEAYDSVRQITYGQPLGWFVRGLHYWSAGLMVVMLFFHLFRQILLGGYKSPREGSWLFGVFLFFGVMIMSLLGYILRWDERGIYALRVALNIFYRVPWIGEELVLLVQGGPEIGSETLSRIYAVHVIIGPLLLTSLIAYHLYLVVRHSITSPTERERPVETASEQRAVYERDALSKERGEIFYPDTVAKSGLMGAIFLALGIGLTFALGGGRLYPEANLAEPSYPMEEWWWSWFSALAALLPPWLASYFYVGFPLLLFVVLILLPFIDRGPHRGMRNRPIAVVLVSACVIALLGLSSLRIRSAWTAWPQPTPPPVPEGMVLPPEAEQGRQLFARYGCNSCHAIDGHGPGVGPDLADLRETLSYAEMRSYILQPPPGVAMPPYEDRLSEEELDRLVDFVMVVQTARQQ